MRYTWNIGKNRQNIRRHKIAFEDAKWIFEGPTVERVDDRFDYGEIRVYAVGLVNGLEVTVIYTDRDPDERHIISAWRSEPHERRYYWQHLEGA
ncbi:MAG: BrnT family toxin [Gammaproteobacteria bacterium]|nr:BrnT family toxin [Gammaproteobacteria bacterium]